MINLTDENFNEKISKTDKPVLVDFWMIGCGPCMLLSPVMEKLEGEFSDKVIFTKANLDDVPFAAQKYGINAAPTVVLFKGGKPDSGFVGLRQESEIRAWLEKDSKNNEGKN